MSDQFENAFSLGYTFFIRAERAREQKATNPLFVVFVDVPSPPLVRGLLTSTRMWEGIKRTPALAFGP